MKHRSKGLIAVTATVLILILMTCLAYAEDTEDRTLSPYFFVKSDDPETDRLPLKSTMADVSIAGVIADVKVTQVYRNEGQKPLEAIYVFPGSTRAAVYGMKMTIGERVIEAEIKKKDDARKIYEDAKHQGKSASLLEQHRPNVFQMNVANIMPGDEIKVELFYTELIVSEDRVYEFAYPTVVGPRYSNTPAGPDPRPDAWVSNPYLHEGEKPTYDFDIRVKLAAGIPISKISSPSHKVHVAYRDKSDAEISLDNSEKKGGNRDYILQYRLDGDRIQTGLLLYKGKDENFFLLMGQPPKRVAKAEIPGREYIFIVDVSGSMHGFPLEISKKLLKDLIGNLRPADVFNVVLFAGSSSVMSERSLPATGDNIQKAISVIDRQRGGGGTELLQALQTALSLPRSENYSRTVIIATDGYVTVEEQSFDLIRNNLGEANMFAFGIGTSVNRHLIEGISFVGSGEPFIITRPEDAPEKAGRFRKLIETPVLTNISVNFQGLDVYDVEPPSIPDILAERPLIVFGKWKGKTKGKIMIKGATGEGPFSESIDVGRQIPDDKNVALRYLWARHRIKLLSDYNSLNQKEERVVEVTELGLKYTLLTAYTSFVAVDTEVRNSSGESIKTIQPLPLPQGVSDYAVAEKAIPSTPFVSGKMALRKEQESFDAAAGGFEQKNAIKLKGVTIKGGLSEKDVRSAAEAHLSELASCGKHQGEVVLILTVNRYGKVTRARLEKAGNAAGFVKCMTDAAAAWSFPSLGGESEVRMTITF